MRPLLIGAKGLCGDSDTCRYNRKGYDLWREGLLLTRIIGLFRSIMKERTSVEEADIGKDNIPLKI